MRNAKISETKTLWMNVNFVHLVVINLFGRFADHNFVDFFVVVGCGVGRDQDGFELVDDSSLVVALFFVE